MIVQHVLALLLKLDFLVGNDTRRMPDYYPLAVEGLLHGQAHTEKGQGMLFPNDNGRISAIASIASRLLSRAVLFWLFCSVCASCSLLPDISTRTEGWSEDAVLQDGRMIKVEREVSFTYQLIAGDSGSPITNASWPDKFWIKFKNPDTQETITWQGEQNYNPVLLDIVDGAAWVVVYGQGKKGLEAEYGCPELPYIYLKYESGFLGKWRPVAVENAPIVLRKANLSPHYPGFQERDAEADQFKAWYYREGRDVRYLSSAEVQSEISDAQQHSSGDFQGVIPRSYEEWNSIYKNGHLNRRSRDDCRPPRASIPQVVLPAPIKGSPEILKTINYTPEHIAIGDEWTNLVFDLDRENECKKLFKLTDPNDEMKGQRFIRDVTGNKPVPYSRSAQFDMGVRVVCDEYVWFVSYREKPEGIIISKYTVAGDIVYRTSFKKPDDIAGFVGNIRVPSIRSEGGYLRFDWLYFNDVGSKWHVKRLMEMRLREPESASLVAP